MPMVFVLYTVEVQTAFVPNIQSYLVLREMLHEHMLEVQTTLCFMQNHANGVDVGVQLLDPPDRALCTDRRQAAAATIVCGWHECHQAVAAAVLLWMPQQCHETASKPSILLCFGWLAFPSGVVMLPFQCNASPLPYCPGRT